jgi:molybdopterin-binding protein
MPTNSETRRQRGEDFISKKYPKAGFGNKNLPREQQNPIVFIPLDFKEIKKEYIDPKKKKERVNFGDTNNTETPVALRKLRDSILDHMSTDKQTETDKTNIKNSLDSIMLYLFSPEEPYETWFRWYAFRGLLDLAPYIYNQEKEKWEFPKRSRNTIKPFPELNRGALAYIQEMHDASHDKSFLEELNAAMEDAPQENLLTQEKVDSFVNKRFKEQYKEGIEKNGTITPELLAKTEGKWIKYHKKSDAIPLWRSLQNKGTGWCTAGLGTAKKQLEEGDSYVYYTPGPDESFTTPRVAIRMDGDEIAEIRGIHEDQNLESNMIDIAEKKLGEFGHEADKYKKIFKDMKFLTELYQQHKEGQVLNKKALRFLYEIDDDIEEFGYNKDPRILKIIKERDNIKGDLALVLDTTEDRVSLTQEEALKGDIDYHHGGLDLSSLIYAEGLKLPKRINEKLDLGSLISTEGLNLPEGIRTLYLDSLISAEGLELPEGIKELYLGSLNSAEGLELPEGIKELSLGSLNSAEGLKLPEGIKELSLGSLNSAEGLKLPEGIKELYLGSLNSAEGLELPEGIEKLYLISLNSAKGLELPEGIKELGLGSLTSAEGLKLPEGIKELDLNGLTSAEGLELPEGIKELYLGSLTSAEGLKLPEGIKELDLNGLTSAEGLELPEGIEKLYLPYLIKDQIPEKLTKKVKIIWL